MKKVFVKVEEYFVPVVCGVIMFALLAGLIAFAGLGVVYKHNTAVVTSSIDTKVHDAVAQRNVLTYSSKEFIFEQIDKNEVHPIASFEYKNHQGIEDAHVDVYVNKDTNLVVVFNRADGVRYIPMYGYFTDAKELVSWHTDLVPLMTWVK